MAKLFSSLEQAERVDRTLRTLRDDVFRPGSGLGLPNTLGVVPQLALLVYAPAEGVRLDLLPPASALAGAREAARWLAELHASSVELDRRLDVTHELENARQWATLAFRRLGSPAAGALELVARLEDRARSLPPAPDVPIHKDFHHAHVLVGAELSVVDLDEARMGDGAFDLAHFCANLRLMGPRGRAENSGLARLEDVFCRAYSERTGWRRDGRFSFFYALNCVKLVKQIANGRGPVGSLTGRERDDRAAAVVEEGLAWAAS
jgi:aminoglycoside phosphotransferase (APT) family kinase protein